MENKKYKEILEPIQLPCGATLSNRIAMAPMLAFGSSDDGTAQEDDLNYFDKRSKVAGLIITGAAFVSDAGQGELGQLGVAHDKNIDGLRSLAKLAKKDGNKVILQLYHGGRESKGSYKRTKRVLAPSKMDFSWLSYEVEEITDQEIRETIKDFGLATKRAIDAGFDGVEIHGANHYLLQQFFSEFSNKRRDDWGGSLVKRMAFPLAIVDQVKKIAKEYGKSDFIVGYRISPEEIHDRTIGYRIDESLQLIEKIVEKNIDYIHISIFRGYEEGPDGSEKSYGQLIMEQVNNRCPVMIVSNVLTAGDAVNARVHGDIVAIGRAALIDPEFTQKIKDGRANEINLSVEGLLDQLALPRQLVKFYQSSAGSSLPKIKGFNA